MAERQQVLRWVRDLLASGSVGAIVATTVTATGIVGTTGDFDSLDVGVAETNDVQLRTGAISAEKNDLSISAPNGTGRVDLAALSEVKSSVATVGSIAVNTISDIRLESDTGHNITLAGDTAGTGLVTISAGDGVTLNGGAGLTPAGGKVGVDANGVSLSTALTSGDDITLSSDDAITMTEVSLSSTASGTQTLATTGGGQVQTTTGGVTLSAANAGDDVTIDTTGGDDLLLTIADAITASMASVSWTASGTQLFCTTAGGCVDIEAGGLNLQATSAGDEVRLDSRIVTRTLVGSGSPFRVPATLQSLTAVFTPVGTSEVAADTLSLPANAWDVTGETLVVTAWGDANTNANDKTIQLRLGSSGSCLTGTVVGSVDFNNASDANWVVAWRIHRTGANAQRGMMDARGTVTNKVDGNTSAARTESAIIDACVTVTNATAANDSDVVGITWEWR